MRQYTQNRTTSPYPGIATLRATTSQPGFMVYYSVVADSNKSSRKTENVSRRWPGKLSQENSQRKNYGLYIGSYAMLRIINTLRDWIKWLWPGARKSRPASPTLPANREPLNGDNQSTESSSYLEPSKPDTPPSEELNEPTNHHAQNTGTAPDGIADSKLPFPLSNNEDQMQPEPEEDEAATHDTPLSEKLNEPTSGEVEADMPDTPPSEELNEATDHHAQNTGTTPDGIADSKPQSLLSSNENQVPPEPEEVEADMPDTPPSEELNEATDIHTQNPEMTPDGIADSKLSVPISSSEYQTLPESEEVEDATPDIPPDEDNQPSSSGSSQESETGRLDEQPSDHSTQSLKAKSSDTAKPREIGSRRHRRSQKQVPRQQQPRLSRPELICWETTRTKMWEVALSWDDECQVSEVRFEGEPVDFDSATGRYSLKSLCGHLTVSYHDVQDYVIPLFGYEDSGKPLIFKLKKGWKGIGRIISGITKGFFIVIAPGNWERTGQKVLFAPMKCTATGFNAHFFYRDTNTPDEDTGGFQEYGVSMVTDGITLGGQCIFDASDEGELFVGKVPSLEPSEATTWVRVGEEIENGWPGETFKPEEQSISEVIGSREGRFFIRVYNSDDPPRLLDSAEFRYLRDLVRIDVNDSKYTEDTVIVPTETGHQNTSVRFVGADDTTIIPTACNKISCVKESGVIDVPPRQDEDRVECTLNSNTEKVKVILELPRIWWRLESSDNIPQWYDKPYYMTRGEFRKHADTNMNISILSRQFPSVKVGFDDIVDRKYTQKKQENYNCITIPLKEFRDYTQIDEMLNDDAHLNIKLADHILPVIVVAAAPKIISLFVEPPTIVAGQEANLQWNCQNANQANIVIDPGIGKVESTGSCSVRPTRTTDYKLTLTASGTNEVSKVVTLVVDSRPNMENQFRVRVKCVRGWREGKGFSAAELEDAGLKKLEACRFIPLDRRRKSSHRTNVDAIRRMLDD